MVIYAVRLIYGYFLLALHHHNRLSRFLPHG